MDYGVSSLFWLSTLIPGFGFIQAVFPHDMRRGILGTLAWSFVLTAALMTPFVATAYLLHFSVSTVAAFYFALVILGLIGIARFGRWTTIRRLLRSTHWPETMVILIAVVATIPFGGSAAEDSFVHAAKIRYLRDVGFGLQDPYSPLPVIETRHHVNTQHAFFAIASWLGGEEPLKLFFEAAWFFRLLGIGAVGYLTSTVFRSRWVGAVSMLAALVVIGTSYDIVYPKKLTAYLVFPLLLSNILDGLENRSGRRYLAVLLCSLSLAAIHVGYWLLAAMCLTPVLIAWGVWHFGRGGIRMAGALLVCVLLAGIPFLLVTALSPNLIPVNEGDEYAWVERVIDLGGGWRFSILDPTHYTWMLPATAATALLLVVRRQSREKQLILAGIFAASMIYMFTPFLFDVLTKFMPNWLIRRARSIGEVIAYANIAGGLAWLARGTLRTRAMRVAFGLTVFCASLVVFQANIKGYFGGRWAEFESLRQAQELQDTVRSVLPAHSLVAADPTLSMILPAVHLSRVMAPERVNGNPADPGLLQRSEDALELLAPGTAQERRHEIVSQNRIDYILVKDSLSTEAEEGIKETGDLVASKHGFRLFKVRTSISNAVGAPWRDP